MLAKYKEPRSGEYDNLTAFVLELSVSLVHSVEQCLSYIFNILIYFFIPTIFVKYRKNVNESGILNVTICLLYSLLWLSVVYIRHNCVTNEININYPKNPVLIRQRIVSPVYRWWDLYGNIAVTHIWMNVTFNVLKSII